MDTWNMHIFAGTNMLIKVTKFIIHSKNGADLQFSISSCVWLCSGQIQEQG